MTDPQGRYTVASMAAGTRTVSAMTPGFSLATRTITLAAGETATADIQLTGRTIGLEEVVVVAYGTQRHRNLTGAQQSASSRWRGRPSWLSGISA